MARKRQEPFIATTRFAFRTPLLPLETFTRWAPENSLEALRSRLQDLLADPIVLDALFVASPDLLASVDAWRREPDSTRGQRVERSLTRYVSRMASRATPFGLFAAVSVGRFGEVGEPTAMTLPERSSYQRSTRIDNDYLFALCETAAADPDVRERLVFRPNSSLYDAGGRLRYAEARLTGKARSHHLVAVEPTEYLERTLERAQAGSRLGPLADALVADDPDIELDEAREYIAELADSQILVSDLAPNVTGAEPVHHTLARLRAAQCDEVASGLASAQQGIEAIDAGGLGADPAAYQRIAGGLEALPVPVELGRLFQVDTAAPPQSATVHPRVHTEIVRAIKTLESLSIPSGETPLDRFRDAFVQRYESREVPLSLALDEEVGIGFNASNAPEAEASPLLAGLPFRGAPDRRRQIDWHPRNQHLLELLHRASRSESIEVELSKSDLKKLEIANPATIPDSFSLMTTVVAASSADVDRGDFRIVVEAAGGPSGARILGRFCLASPEHDAIVREHIKAEEALRPDAVFAEIAHLPEGRIGNILCRPVLRDYEISFLGISGADEEHQLPVSDLMISVQRSRVVLRSKRLDREIIPRLSTAHNFGLRSLGVYRFLCSLQAQGSDWVGWSWGPLDAAKFLPRVRVGRHVLSKARWLLDEDDLKPLAEASKGSKKATKPEQIRALREGVMAAARALRDKRQLPRFVVLADGDNELPVDFENPLSVDSFVALVKNRPGAELGELYPGDDALLVSGPDGNHVHQIVVPFVRAQEPTRAPLSVQPPEGSGRYPPGSEWLYAKIYTGSSTADDVLRDAIWPIAKAVIAAGDADRWFFLRYGDPDWHLRVRFRGDPQRLRSAVLPKLETAFAQLAQAGTVWKLQIDTYDQETVRYGGAAGVELAEEIFCADSEAICEIVELLEGDEGAVARWQLCVRGIDMLLEDLGFDLPERQSLMSSARAGFASEFHADTALLKELGKRFRDSAGELVPLLARDPAIDVDHPFEPGFVALARRSPRIKAVAVTIRERQDELTTDLRDMALSFVHMHVNRLIRSAARAHELVLYDFLTRYYDMRIARAKQAAKKSKGGDKSKGNKSTGNKSTNS